MLSTQQMSSLRLCRNGDVVLLGGRMVSGGLSRKTRRMRNLAMVSALNRPHEIETHVRAAINNGLTWEEIREIFLRVAIYYGVPAAVNSFRSARRVFAGIDAKS